MVDKSLKKIDLTPTLESSPMLTPKPQPKTQIAINIASYLIVIFLGLGSGYLIYSVTPHTSSKASSSYTGPVSPEGLKVGDIVGYKDESGFKDQPATGVLEEGGLNGEGSHKLLREGGVSQTVYLTSSSVELNQFIGHKVTVWGQTFNSQKAGWLMDVGRVKIEQLNAPTPSVK